MAKTTAPYVASGGDLTAALVVIARMLLKTHSDDEEAQARDRKALEEFLEEHDVEDV